MYNSLLIRRSYLAEINFTNIPANGDKVYFFDIPQLREVVVTGVEAFCTTEMVTSPNGKVMVANLRGLAVTLAIASDERFYQWPCLSMQSSQQGGIIRELYPVRLSLPKSYVTIIDATTIAQNQSVCFNFYFEVPPKR